MGKLNRLILWWRIFWQRGEFKEIEVAPNQYMRRIRKRNYPVSEAHANDAPSSGGCEKCGGLLNWQRSEGTGKLVFRCVGCGFEYPHWCHVCELKGESQSGVQAGETTA